MSASVTIHTLLDECINVGGVKRRVARDSARMILQETARSLRRLSDAVGGESELLAAASKVESALEDIE